MSIASTANQTEPLRVLVVEESDLVVHGLINMLLPFHQSIRLIDQDEHAIEAAELVLYDAFAGAPDRPMRTRGLAKTGALVVYTWQLHPNLVRLALARGARGCLSKQLTAAELTGALDRIRRGDVVVQGGTEHPWQRTEHVRLTPREAEVLALIARGFSNQEVATEIGLSLNSVKSYIRSAYRKMEVTSRTQAVLWAIGHGYAATSPRQATRHEATPPATTLTKRSYAEAFA